MKTIRNEKHISGRRRIGVILSFTGMGILLAGLVLTFAGGEDPTAIILSFTALPLGWAISQVGLYFANRYVRSPRPDEQIDNGFGSVGGDARLYHYVLPTPHVILARSGIIVIVAKYQSGNITADGYKWKQTGVGFFRRFFGQENLGNPSLEAEYHIKQVAKFISNQIPDLADISLPIGAIIAFTTKDGGDLDLKRSDIPALHYTKLKGFWKQRRNDAPMTPSNYDKLRAAFDAEAQKAGALTT